MTSDNLSQANDERTRAAADRDIVDALLLSQPAIFPGLTARQRQVVQARLNLPVSCGWRALAATIGLTKDQAAGAFRRARISLLENRPL